MKIVTKNTEYRAMDIVGGSSKSTQICLCSKKDNGNSFRVIKEVGVIYDKKLAKLVAGFCNSLR